MNVHRWYPYVGAACLLLLFCVSTVHAQNASVAWSPTDPVAYEPITFYIQPSSTSIIYVYIIPPGMACQGGFTGVGGSCGGPILTLKPGQLNVTLRNGLREGTYGLLIETQSAGGIDRYYSTLTVSPSRLLGSAET